jgi:hypothetical protein
VLRFLDRDRELDRLGRALRRREGSFLCLYGRRRVGKSRLLQEAFKGLRTVYYVGDERDPPLQRSALAQEIGRVLHGFSDVSYDGWGPLLDRWWADAPASAALVLDEFPYLASASPEIPSLLQKLVDRLGGPARHLAVCGSSQGMMHGLVLSEAAPLFGRAREIIRVEPLGAGWIGDALGLRDPAKAVDHYAAWGGIPRYWELALEHPDRARAVLYLVLDPLGVLHREPERLLRDEMTDVARAASLLALIGQGCHRVSEIAGGLGLPATSLARPLTRLVDLGLVAREVPFGRSIRDTKRTYYRISDPFLRMWYRFVEPNRSRLAAGQLGPVARSVAAEWPRFLGAAWEDLARSSVARLEIAGSTWSPAARWWGPGTDSAPLEIDIVAEALDGSERLLVGEAKLALTAGGIERAQGELRGKARRCPVAVGKEVVPVLFCVRGPPRRLPQVLTARDVLEVLR